MQKHLSDIMLAHERNHAEILQSAPPQSPRGYEKAPVERDPHHPLNGPHPTD